MRQIAHLPARLTPALRRHIISSSMRHIPRVGQEHPPARPALSVRPMDGAPQTAQTADSIPASQHHFRASWRRLAMQAAGPLLGVILLVASGWGTDWRSLLEAFRQAQLLFVLLTILSVVLTILMKAARWRALCRYPPIGRQPFLNGIVIGQFANALLPGRAGDLARWAVLGRRQDPGYLGALGSVIAEKALDALMLMVLMVIVLPLSPQLGGLDGRRAAVAAGSGGLVMLFGLLALRSARLRHWLAGQVGRLLRRWDAAWPARVQVGLRRMADASPAHWLPWLQSLLVWLMAAVTNTLAFHAFGLTLPWTAAVLLLVALHAGRLVNITPGQVGIFHSITVWVLNAYGVPRPTAFAYSLFLHLSVTLPPILWGLWALRHESLHWGELLLQTLQETTRRRELS
ncbi:MAG: lysylphosphatidylglycerol synthase transmembrane domain-containing protein [Anaerolineae bacterium]